MNFTTKVFATFNILASIVCMVLVASAQDEQRVSQPREKLTISPDTKFLLDSTGKKVRQFLGSAEAYVPMTVKDKNGHEFDPAMPDKSNKSCMPCRCHYECNRWDENGHCNLWIRTCDICCTEGP